MYLHILLYQHYYYGAYRYIFLLLFQKGSTFQFLLKWTQEPQSHPLLLALSSADVCGFTMNICPRDFGRWLFFIFSCLQ